MNRRIFWTDAARAGPRELHDFISAHDVKAARRWLRRIRRAVERAADVPGVGRWLPERAVLEIRDPSIREVLVGSCRVIYRATPTRLIVLSVFDGRRLLRAKDAAPRKLASLALSKRARAEIQADVFGDYEADKERD